MKTTLSAKDICDIIAQCGNSHISKFEYAGLKLSFSRPDDGQKAFGPEVVIPPTSFPEQPQAPIAELSEEEKELQALDDLKFTNPVLFEEQLRKLSNGRA